MELPASARCWSAASRCSTTAVPATRTSTSCGSSRRHARVSLFGTSAAFLAACLKAGLRPGATNDLSQLEAIGSTGSPLAVETFGWVYDAVKPRRLAGLDERRDRCRHRRSSAAAALLPVHAGELQARVARGEGRGVRRGRSVGRRPDRRAGADRAAAVDAASSSGTTRTAPATARAISRCIPGVWRHGDWIRITERGSAVIEGRSDSTLNRQGIRFGTSELYGVVERLPEILDSLVIGLELPDGGYWMPLFVVLAEGVELDDALIKRRITAAIRDALSQRHVPDEIVAVPAIPRTLTGKKMEVPVKRLLQGRPLAEVAAPGATADPAALDWFAAFAAERRTETR